MEKRPGINMAKQDTNETKLIDKGAQSRELQSWNDDIKRICNELVVSSESFEVEKTYKEVESFLFSHKRWLYSVVSSFLFGCSEQDLSTFISNLDGLREYAYVKVAECTEEDTAKTKLAKKVATSIDKLWDHSNLAHTQNQSLHDSDATFKARFDTNLIPFKAEFTKEMNMQFISLIAIFTALSFLVFGGITSLDNVFSAVGSIPVLELMIAGSIWSICITNLVFVFIFLIAKLTRLNIKSTEREGATLSQRYPFFVWSNFLLMMVLAVCSWLYFIDYADAGSWLLRLTKNNSMFSIIGGIAVIGVSFGLLAVFLARNPKKKDSIDIEKSEVTQ